MSRKETLALTNAELELGALRSYAASKAFRDRCGARPEWFTLGPHELAFRALLGLHEAGQPIHRFSLEQALVALSQAGSEWEAATAREQAKGLAASVCERPAAWAQVDSRSAAHLGELSRLRRLKGAAEAISDACSREDTDGASEAVARLADAAASASRQATRATAYEACCQSLAGYGLGGTDGASFVDPVLAGLRGSIGRRIPTGSMIMLGASTNTGKSSMALAWLMAMAQAGTPVGYISAEDGPMVVGARLMASQGGPVASLQEQRVTREDMAELDRAIQQLHGVPLYASFLDRDEVRDELSVCAEMGWQARQGAKLIVVDYVQAITSSTASQDRRNEIRLLTQRLKARAASLGVVLVLVSQLARPPKDRPNAEPSKHDGKESGDLENSAEVVLMMWRDQENDFSRIHIKVAKGKWGGVGKRWDMSRSTNGWLQECDQEVEYGASYHG